MNSEHLRAGFGHHQPGVKETSEAGGRDSRVNNAIQNGSVLSRAKDARIAVGAHPARVGSRVIIIRGFVILGGFQRNGVAAIAQNDVADFFAGHELFHHVRRLQRFESGFRHGAILGNYDPLTRGQAIGFDHHRVAEAIERPARRGGIRRRNE